MQKNFVWKIYYIWMLTFSTHQITFARILHNWRKQQPFTRNRLCIKRPHSTASHWWNCPIIIISGSPLAGLHVVWSHRPRTVADLALDAWPPSYSSTQEWATLQISIPSVARYILSQISLWANVAARCMEIEDAVITRTTLRWIGARTMAEKSLQQSEQEKDTVRQTTWH